MLGFGKLPKRNIINIGNMYVLKWFEEKKEFLNSIRGWIIEFIVVIKSIFVF